MLGFGNIIVTTETLVNFEDLASEPHVPERILDVKMKHLHFKIMREFKIKWTDKSIKGVKWEQEHTLKTNFPNFSLQEANVLKRWSMLRA